jgi:phage-related protein
MEKPKDLKLILEDLKKLQRYFEEKQWLDDGFQFDSESFMEGLRIEFPGIPGLWNGFGFDVPTVPDIIDSVKTSIDRDLIGPAKKTLTDAFNAATAGFNKLISDAQAAVEKQIKTITDLVNDIPNQINKLIATVKDFFTTQLNTLISTGTSLINTIKDKLIKTFNDIAPQVCGCIERVIDQLAKSFDSISAGILRFVDQLSVKIKDSFGTLIDSIKSLFQTLNDQITNTFNTITKSITSVFDTLASQITKVFNTLIDSLKSFFSSLGDQITSTFNILMRSMKSFFETLADQIKSNIDAITSSMTKFFKSLSEGITSSFNTLGSSMNGFFNDLTAQMTRGFNTAMSSMGSFFKQLNSDMSSSFDTLGSSMGGWFSKMGDGLNTGFGAIGGWFESFTWRFVQLGKGLDDIFGGLFVDEPIGLGKGLSKGFFDIGALLMWTSEFLFSNLHCGGYFIYNLNYCFVYYMIDTILQIMYLPVRFALWFIATYAQKDSYAMEQEIWKYIYMADYEVHYYLGFHFAKWDKSIRDRCYNCRRLKMHSLQRKAAEVNYDFMVKMPQLLGSGVERMNRGAAEFRSAFQ